LYRPTYMMRAVLPLLRFLISQHLSSRYSAPIRLQQEIAIDDHPHRKSRPDRERRLDVEIAASDLLAGLIERCAAAPAAGNRLGIPCRRCVGGQSGSTMAIDHRTGHRRGRLSPGGADRIGHKLLARGISRDGHDCFGNGRCGRPAHDCSVDVRRQPPHGCGIRAKQRSRAHWRIGCYSPYRTCDSVIVACVAFSFWCRRSDRRSHLFGSNGERFYVDRPAGKTQPSVEP
jgi:hypothetical protein